MGNKTSLKERKGGIKQQKALNSVTPMFCNEKKNMSRVENGYSARPHTKCPRLYKFYMHPRHKQSMKFQAHNRKQHVL